MIYREVNFNDFVDSFKNYDRENQFSYDGKRALFDYLEGDMTEDKGTDIELDVIALCCEYTEYECLDALRVDYPKIKSMEDLEDNTTVIMLEDEKGFIIQQF